MKSFSEKKQGIQIPPNQRKRNLTQRRTPEIDYTKPLVSRLLLAVL